MGQIWRNRTLYSGVNQSRLMMTQAEYDQLPSSEKNDGQFRVITDAPSVIDLIYPVGSVYISVNNVNPGTYLAGTTWTAFGTGRTLVGVDTTQTEFNTIEKTGGAKTHTHNVGIRLNGYYYSTTGLEGASGINGIIRYDANNNISAPAAYTTPTNTTVTINSGVLTGSKSSGSNIYQSVGNTSYSSDLQPYITVYMWKRTH